ncbi:hypothetical protein BO71DRAFT_327752, partial [Aspergillus ellipticus CBS 707.79]
TDPSPAVTTGTAACTTIVRPPDRTRLAIPRAHLLEGQLRTEDANTPETESTPDPVTAVGTVMITAGAPRARLRPGEDVRGTRIATARATARRDTTAAAEATVAAANRITDRRAER